MNNIELCVFGFCIFIAFLTITGLITWLFKKTEAVVTFNKRMGSLWVLILLFTLALAFNKAVATIFFLILSVASFIEYQKMIGIKFSDKKPYFLTYFLIPLQYYFLYKGWMILFLIFIPLSIFVLVPAVGIVHRNCENVWRNCMLDYIGLILTVYCMGYMAVYLTFPYMTEPTALGLLVYILILSLMCDFFQAIFGQTIGKHKILPKVSPNKTWEGLIGGMILTGVLSYYMGKYLTSYSAIELFIFGCCLAVCCFGADVTISSIKRWIGVKDTGNILPGHGGLLDRFDSILFSAPVLYFYVILTQNILIH